MSLNVYVIIGQRHGSDALEQIGAPIHAVNAREAFLPYRSNPVDADYQRAWLCRAEPEWDMRLTHPDAAKPLAPVVPEPPTTTPAADLSSPEQPPVSGKKRK